MKHPKVFISYSHIGDAFEQKMFEFANKLRKDGIDANIDLFEESPSEGWPRWMENQIRQSEYVLIVCNEAYSKKFYDAHGKGVTWEVQIIYQKLYDDNCETSKFIPVYWDDGDDEFILKPLKPYTYYHIGSEEGYKKLWNRLMGIKKYEKAELGEIDNVRIDESDKLPAKKQHTMFFTTPINLEYWNEAHWKGMLYWLDQRPKPECPPMLGFVYENYQAAEKIFKEWHKTYRSINPDDYIEINYIIPPLPADCYVNKDADHNFGKGYFVHIGPNLNKAAERAISLDGGSKQSLLTMLSRYTWVDELHGSIYRTTFQQQVGYFHEFSIVPVSQIDKNGPMVEENLHIGREYAITLHNVKFKVGKTLSEHDHCRVVLRPAEEFDKVLEELKGKPIDFLENAIMNDEKIKILENIRGEISNYLQSLKPLQKPNIDQYIKLQDKIKNTVVEVFGVGSDEHKKINEIFSEYVSPLIGSMDFEDKLAGSIHPTLIKVVNIINDGISRLSEEVRRHD